MAEVSFHGRGQVDLGTVHGVDMQKLLLGWVGCVSLAKCLQYAELGTDWPPAVLTQSGEVFGL